MAGLSKAFDHLLPGFGNPTGSFLFGIPAQSLV